MFKRIVKRINKLSLTLNCLITLTSIFLGCLLIFVSGTTNPQSYLEKTAIHLSDIVKKETQNNTFLSVQVSLTDNTKGNNLISTYNEYFYWKYIFRHSDFGFVSSVNGGKTHDCHYKEIPVDDNITFITSGNNSNHPYEGYFKHEVYDIKLMFSGSNSFVGNSINFFAISKTNADILLTQRGVETIDGTYSIEQYNQIIGTNTIIELDGVEYSFTISNIFFEEGNFYNNATLTFGEFVVSYIRFPDQMENEASYIFNTYNYQNYHKLKRIKELCSLNPINISSSTYNLHSQSLSDSINKELNNTLFSSSGNMFLYVFLLIVSLLICLLGFFYLYAISSQLSIKHFLLFLVCSVLPYLILWLINCLVSIPLIFSYGSLSVFSLVFLAVIIFTAYRIVLVLRKKYAKNNSKI